MFRFSKSKYCLVWRCPKLLWLKKNKPEEEELDAGTLARFETGNEVGDLAMGLFGDFVEVTKWNGDELDPAAMIEATKAEMERGTENICEASFSYDGLYCAVDILKKEGDGWAIYEVKSSTEPEKQIYLADVAYQKYVLEHCGVKVVGAYTVVMNKEYSLEGELDLKKLFVITDVSALLAPETAKLTTVIAEAKQVLLSDEEPAAELSLSCHKPYECGFFKYCTRELPKPSVFDLYGLSFKRALEYLLEGRASFSDLVGDESINGEIQLRQIDHELNDRGTYVDKEGIRAFLDTLSYPLYFLDFETMQTVVPLYQGTKPYTQIPFQYSLHYYETEEGELKHKEFLAESGPDPRRAIAEGLCADIPRDACVLVFNMTFEKGRIKELAEAFPDLADRLLNIRDHIADLLVPFRKGYYYNRAMGGSFSIKSVLPAIFPDDPELDYHSLEGVHHGGEAMTVFPQLQYMAPEDRERMRRSLLKYCELDTYAMVKVLEELIRVSR